MATDLDMRLDGHTPGPWVPCDTDSEHTTLISGNDGSGATRNGGIYIARVQGPDNRANARLIAAAPDLLAALEALRDRGHTEATWFLAKKAIAKARGAA